MFGRSNDPPTSCVRTVRTILHHTTPCCVHWLKKESDILSTLPFSTLRLPIFSPQEVFADGASHMRHIHMRSRSQLQSPPPMIVLKSGSRERNLSRMPYLSPESSL